MMLKVMVKARSPNPRIESFGDNNFLAYVSSEAENNQANIELIQMLSRHFGVSYKHIKIKAGLTSKNKLIEVN